MKKIDNRKIDFYVINYFYNFFLFFTGGCNFTLYKKNGTGGGQPVPTLNDKKKASNRSCLELHFVQKSPWMHSTDMVVIGTEIANYIHLGFNAAKNTHYFKKSIKWKLFKTEFCTKKFVRSWGSIFRFQYDRSIEIEYQKIVKNWFFETRFNRSSKKRWKSDITKWMQSVRWFQCF